MSATADVVAELRELPAGEQLIERLGRHCVVGVLGDGRLVEWSPAMWECYAVDVPDRPAASGWRSTPIDRFATIAALERWIRTQRWTWLHPRFRWVVDR